MFHHKQPGMLVIHHCLELVVRRVQIDQHDDPRLSGHSGQGYKSHTDCHTHVVTQEIQEPESAGEREGDAQHDYQAFGDVFEVEKEQQEDDDQRHGHHDHESLLGPNHVFVLATPNHAVACR